MLLLADEEEYKSDPKKVVLDATGSIVKTLEETRSGMKVDGDGRIIPGINEETGALIILADICEWVAETKSGIPPYLESNNKKIGLNVYPISQDNQVCTMSFVADFHNAMM